MRVRILGAHNVESRRSKMAALLVDNVIAVDAGGLTSSLSLAAQFKLKALLLTHQHYDHIRDLPNLAMALFLRQASLDVYSTIPVRDALKTYLFDGKLYPDFFEPREGNRVLIFKPIEPNMAFQILTYSILAVPVIHSVPAVGFQITGEHGESLFYTGDTGPGLYETWRHVSPHVLIVELTSPNRDEDHSRLSGHLTPALLKNELLTFKRIKGYLPKVVTVHMNPSLESEIATQIEAVAQEIEAEISLAREGMELDIPLL